MRLFDHRSGESLQLGDANLYYETTGEAGAPTLLLLHGGFGTIEEFNSVLSRLTGRFHVVGIDSRGQGKSTLGTKPLSYRQIQEDVEQVIAHLGLSDVVLCGFSDGGIVGLRIAAEGKVRIRKLVTIGARFVLKPEDSLRKIFSRITGQSWRAKFPATYEIYQRVNPQPDFDRLAEAMVKMWLDSGETGYPAGKIDSISCPTFLVRGDDDPLCSRELIMEAARRIKGAKLSNIAFAGHVAFEDQLDVFMRGLNTFLS
ncbi:MAG: alpha/beta hydrolase [Nibricoccus sp.]